MKAVLLCLTITISSLVCGASDQFDVSRFDGDYTRIKFNGNIKLVKYRDINSKYLNTAYFKDVTNESNEIYNPPRPYKDEVCPHKITVIGFSEGNKSPKIKIGRYGDRISEWDSVGELVIIDRNYVDTPPFALRILTLNNLIRGWKYISKEDRIINSEHTEDMMFIKTSIKKLKNGRIKISDKARNHGFINRQFEWLKDEHDVTCEYAPFQ